MSHYCVNNITNRRASDGRAAAEAAGACARGAERAPREARVPCAPPARPAPLPAAPRRCLPCILICRPSETPQENFLILNINYTSILYIEYQKIFYVNQINSDLP